MKDSKQVHSAKFLRMRRFFVGLPFLIIVFTLIAFVAFGGGKGKKPTVQETNNVDGLNTELPPAHFDKKELDKDKLGFCTQADQDSMKRLDQRNHDPYFGKSALSSFLRPGSLGKPFVTKSTEPSISRVEPGPDPKADLLLQKLDQLKKSLPEPAVSTVSFPGRPVQTQRTLAPQPEGDMSKMEKLLQGLHKTDTGGDRNIDRINDMLDKVMRIQSQQGVKKPDTIGNADFQKGVLEVVTKKDSIDIGDFSEGTKDSLVPVADGFYTIDDNGSTDTMKSNLILAVVAESQTVVAGSTLSVRLTADVLIGGILIPKGNPLSGKVSWQNDRLILTIHSIRCKNTEYQVSLSAYDMDGLEGLNIPGSITRDVVKESADQGIGVIGLGSLDPSLGAQAAAAGIQTAKALASRKAKLVRGYVPSGYQVFLQNTKTSSR